MKPPVFIPYVKIRATPELHFARVGIGIDHATLDWIPVPSLKRPIDSADVGKVDPQARTKAPFDGENLVVDNVLTLVRQIGGPSGAKLERSFSRFENHNLILVDIISCHVFLHVHRHLYLDSDAAK